MQNNSNELKNIELKLLKALIEICKKYNLKYFLIGGSCIGAVRHNGFIPWDDDIDVGMPREDYNTFLEVAQKELPENIFLQTNITEPEYPIGFAQLRDSDTTMVGIRTQHMNINHGVYIDIFPLDGFPENKVLQGIAIIRNKIYSLSIGRNMQIKEDKKSNIHSFFKFAAQNIAKVIYPDIKETVRKRENFMRKYTYKNSRIIVNYCGRWGNKEIAPKDWFGEGVVMKFEDIEVTVPIKYHEYLTRMYGDYMMPPPPEQRGGHLCAIVDTRKSYKLYRDNETNETKI